jgi:hypothetical protein
MGVPEGASTQVLAACIRGANYGANDVVAAGVPAVVSALLFRPGVLGPAVVSKPCRSPPRRQTRRG